MSTTATAKTGSAAGIENLQGHPVSACRRASWPAKMAELNAAADSQPSPIDVQVRRDQRAPGPPVAPHDAAHHGHAGNDNHAELQEDAEERPDRLGRAHDARRRPEQRRERQRIEDDPRQRGRIAACGVDAEPGQIDELPPARASFLLHGMASGDAIVTRTGRHRILP